MDKVNKIFKQIERIIDVDSDCKFISIVKKINNKLKNQSNENTDTYKVLKNFLQSIFKEIDNIAQEIKQDDTLLISVKNQKILRTCFELVTSFGILQCLIPGLGISLSKRSVTSNTVPSLHLSDEQKYELLVDCTNFFVRSYNVPVLKNIIMTSHLSDYLAALIQLSFAPLKKPGVYSNFTMTEEMYVKLNTDRKQYIELYEYLVSNCFQPILMKELLVLQNGADQAPPAFVKKVIAKEMSRRLMAPGGLLSFIRCLIDSYDMDTGLDWRKVEMICKIVSVRHGNVNEEIYLSNICAQLKQILTINNTQYLTTAVTCLLSLSEKYPQNGSVHNLGKETFGCLDYDHLKSISDFPGTVILTPQEVEHRVFLLHACVCTIKMKCPVSLLTPNLYVSFLLALKCTKKDIKMKLNEFILKCLEQLNNIAMCKIVKMFLFGSNNQEMSDIIIENYEAGLIVKYTNSSVDYMYDDSQRYILELFNDIKDTKHIHNLFETCVQIFIDLNAHKQQKDSSETLLILEDDIVISNNDIYYANILNLLSEMSASPKLINALKSNPSTVIDFVGTILLRNLKSPKEESSTIALVLLNTILSNTTITTNMRSKLQDLIPLLKKYSEEESNFENILYKEALSLILSENPVNQETAYSTALADVFDKLLPVRAHGIMELTKLIDAADSETISKRHYIFCLFQEQLKDPDTYIYLSAINGIASLGTHCTEDVLAVLCTEFLQFPNRKTLETKTSLDKMAELRMKIGDIIVKVTRRLGEMAIVHKTTLLNTMLCGCRDDDPLIRTSALSNLAEIAVVLHYKIGTIIYEVLLCIWSIIETDKAIECRRAAVMVISSLLKGLGRETLVELKENILPIYRTLNKLYKDNNEDSVVRLHAQIALEELNEIVNQFLFAKLPMEKDFVIQTSSKDIVYK